MCASGESFMNVAHVCDNDNASFALCVERNLTQSGIVSFVCVYICAYDVVVIRCVRTTCCLLSLSRRCQQVFDAYSEKRSIDLNGWRFFFDGQRINNQQSPKDVRVTRTTTHERKRRARARVCVCVCERRECRRRRLVMRSREYEYLYII